jgi:hypothetical protein
MKKLTNAEKVRRLFADADLSEFEIKRLARAMKPLLDEMDVEDFDED